jgi:hypothetical protein
MKKILTLTFVGLFLFSGCTLPLDDDFSEDEVPENEVPDVVVEVDVEPESALELELDLVSHPPFCVRLNPKLNTLTQEEFLDLFKNKHGISKHQVGLLKPFYLLLHDEQFEEISAASTYGMICSDLYHSYSATFALYGDYGEENNAIGMYDGENLVVEYLFNQDMGDIGACRIIGRMGNSLLYSCGGGDGPFSFHKYFLLNTEGENLTVQDCSRGAGDESNEYEVIEKCEVDLLGVGYDY